jgi:hypothetical protein
MSRARTHKDPEPSKQRDWTVRKDREYDLQGGWKVHLTIGPNDYQKRATEICCWLKTHVKGREPWKHLHGGEMHEKDFTVYLGSHATMMRFVSRIEGDPVINLLDPSKAGGEDRIVGKTGKLGARFDTGNTKYLKGWFDYYGSKGIPVADQYAVLKSRKCRNGHWLGPEAVRRSYELLKQQFGDYFEPPPYGQFKPPGTVLTCCELAAESHISR